MGESYFQVDTHGSENGGGTPGDGDELTVSDDEYEPMSEDEIDDAHRGYEYRPFSDHGEDESSVAPAVPAEGCPVLEKQEQACVVKPSIHQVKQIYRNPDEPHVLRYSVRMSFERERSRLRRLPIRGAKSLVTLLDLRRRHCQAS